MGWAKTSLDSWVPHLSNEERTVSLTVVLGYWIPMFKGVKFDPYLTPIQN